jgi:hypothetical protein
MVKEELLTFEGRPLFLRRRASTVPYPLSGLERDLYEAVTGYVRREWSRVDALYAAGESRRGNTVGFALTVLQRRLASSPEAILRSLERRRTRLENRRDEIRYGQRPDPIDAGSLATVSRSDQPERERSLGWVVHVVSRADGVRQGVDVCGEGGGLDGQVAHDPGGVDLLCPFGLADEHEPPPICGHPR